MSSTARRCSPQYAHSYSHPTPRRNHTFSQQTTRTKANSSTSATHKIFQVRNRQTQRTVRFSVADDETRKVFDTSRVLIKIAFMFLQFIRHVMNQIYRFIFTFSAAVRCSLYLKNILVGFKRVKIFKKNLLNTTEFLYVNKINLLSKWLY
jgi:hypothetical protein